MKFKVIELFGGIGACTAALKRMGIDVEIVDYVEIDKYAVASYNAINGTNFEPQDVKDWDKDLKADLIMHGSPCQDFSIAGKQAGGDEGSGTRSSLMYETIRIVGMVMPRFVIWENVANVVSERHIHNLHEYISRLNVLGYRSYWKLLNAKNFGIPQNRERLFVVSVRDYVFPEGEELNLRLKDMLEDEVDSKYFLTSNEVAYVGSRAKPKTMYTDIDSDVASTLTTGGHNNWQGSFVHDIPKGVIVGNRGGHYKGNRCGNHHNGKGSQRIWELCNDRSCLKNPRIEVKGNTNPSKTGQGGVVYGTKGIMGTISSEHGAVPRIAEDERR